MNRFSRLPWLSDQWQLIRPYGRYLYYRLHPQRRPSYFRAAWLHGSKRLGIDAIPPVCSGQETVFLFFPMVDWHVRTQRSQHLAMALAKLGHTCIYVSPHLGLEYEKPFLMDGHTRIGSLGTNLYELHIHLPREHAINERALRQSEVDRTTSEIRKFLTASGIDTAVSVVSLPSWRDVCANLRESHGFPIVYDCHDWLPGFQRIAPEIVDLEAGLLETCDRIGFSSQHLMNSVVKRHPSVLHKSTLVRNAVTALDFGSKRSGRSGVVGYAGSLDHWFDVNAVMKAAKSHPQLKFELLGRVEHPRIDRLRSCANVEICGEVAYADLGERLRSWDAGLIPFLSNSLTLAANPIKLYEYFSLGLPVVSTRLPEVEMYRDAVYLAGSAPSLAQNSLRPCVRTIRPCAPCG